jgi:hypothetical protein
MLRMLRGLNKSSGVASMTHDHHRSPRRSRRLQPALELVEGRILLSTGAGTAIPFRDQSGALLASRRIALRGNLVGSIAEATTDGQNFVLTVTFQGSTGNARLGGATIVATATANAAQLSGIGKTTISGQNIPLQLTSAGGTAQAVGTLTLSRTRSLSRVPFRLSATLVSGTGVLAGATGSFTLQGNFNVAAMGTGLRAQLRGSLRTAV